MKAGPLLVVVKVSGMAAPRTSLLKTLVEKRVMIVELEETKA